jgi:hypothetical protein
MVPCYKSSVEIMETVGEWVKWLNNSTYTYTYPMFLKLKVGIKPAKRQQMKIEIGVYVWF